MDEGLEAVSTTSDARQAFTVRLDAGCYEWVRRNAFDRRISMLQVVTEALDLYRNTPAWSQPEDEDADAEVVG